MISMKEIGKICGVTESTVSKALRGHAGIKQATRERVMEVARKYGYQPNAMVECMQTGKSRSIGIACLARSGLSPAARKFIERARACADTLK